MGNPLLNESQDALPMGNTKGMGDDMEQKEDALPMGDTKGRDQGMESVSSPLLSDHDQEITKGQYEVFMDDDDKEAVSDEYVHVDGDHGVNPLLSDEENNVIRDVGIDIPSNDGKDGDEDSEEEYDDDMIFDDEFNPLTPGGEHKRIVPGFGVYNED